MSPAPKKSAVSRLPPAEKLHRSWHLLSYCPAAPESSEIPLFNLLTTNDEGPESECQLMKELIPRTRVVYEVPAQL